MNAKLRIKMEFSDIITVIVLGVISILTSISQSKAKGKETPKPVRKAPQSTKSDDEVPETRYIVPETEEESFAPEEEPEEDEAEAEDEDAVELEEIQVATGEELIKTILKAHELTQANLAEAAGVSRSAVSTNLNKGVNAIQLDDFVAYVDALGYEIIVLPKNAEQNDAVYALTPETQVEAE